MRIIERTAALLLTVALLFLPEISASAAELPEGSPPAAESVEEAAPIADPEVTGTDTPEHGEALITYLEEKRAGFPVGRPVTFMDEARIWCRLLALTGNPYGAAGAMGNLSAESDLKTGNLQNCWEPILNYSDEAYTLAVDNGTYPDFIDDGAGYGLAQWTFHSRKARLYALAKEAGKSVSDIGVQLDLLEEELSSCSALAKLRSAESVAEASDAFLTDFERPGEISGGLMQSRRNLGEYFYYRFALEQNPESAMTEAQRAVILAAAKSDETELTGQKWMEHIFTAAGLSVGSSCCAYHAAEKNRVSDNWREVPPGAAVYGYAGGEYGHVGIYVGGGLVCHCDGTITVDSLPEWIQKYQGFCWGWEAGMDLTK